MRLLFPHLKKSHAPSNLPRCFQPSLESLASPTFPHKLSPPPAKMYVPPTDIIITCQHTLTSPRRNYATPYRLIPCKHLALSNTSNREGSQNLTSAWLCPFLNLQPLLLNSQTSLSYKVSLSAEKGVPDFEFSLFSYPLHY